MPIAPGLFDDVSVAEFRTFLRKVQGLNAEVMVRLLNGKAGPLQCRWDFYPAPLVERRAALTTAQQISLEYFAACIAFWRENQSSGKLDMALAPDGTLTRHYWTPDGKAPGGRFG